jgi:hypothetical protein
VPEAAAFGQIEALGRRFTRLRGRALKDAAARLGAGNLET